ncbi:probable G-protein coupled receptor 149 [Paramormyrops kingsleyae]|uniref:probable G-protein coupled receptor 149 n=1 Tax=Paramormyrops kingsleyae TaxID=1676925 RepID=UPI003B979257
MSVKSSAISLNDTDGQDMMDFPEVKKHMNLVLFGLSIVIAFVTLVGGVCSLIFLLKMRRKTPLSLIVASMSIDDLISVIPVSLFILGQWQGHSAGSASCTLSALLYVFQGVSSNMKASLIVAYTFCVTRRFTVFRCARRPLIVSCAIAAVWLASLAVSLLPVCGWGSFSQTSLGCFAEGTGSYALLLFVLYSLSFCGFVAFSIPLTHQLLCSGEPQKAFHPNYGGSAADGSAPLCHIPSLSRDSLEKSFETFSEINSEPVGLKSHTCPTSAAQNSGKEAALNSANSTQVFAQKRFSFIMAMVRILLWMPMMVQILVSHVVQVRSPVFETPSFFLTLLSATITPLFFLSKRWVHLPCGCFINCRRDVAPQPSAGKKRGFEFNLSFQQGYGIYKISQAKLPTVETAPYHSLFDYECSESRPTAARAGPISRGTSDEFRIAAAEDSSQDWDRRAVAPREASSDGHGPGPGSVPGPTAEDHNLDNSSVFEGPERRLSHGGSRKMELSDWEWCRSKSERTPRQVRGLQRSSGGLSIPLCAFQGTVSLHAPTGKTLSLSTYEVSSDGLKISPNNKKVEVYRSKSVGHEPRTEEPADGTTGDTNVKIHLEVLEICDNEEAMDSVSIISNISQSSAHARSPSLRYSRRENRFVSCDLGETASYSLLIPTSNHDSDINIHIPDTVEAHRRNSRKQHQERSGYQEEIQLLNEAYRRQEGARDT